MCIEWDFLLLIYKQKNPVELCRSGLSSDHKAEQSRSSRVLSISSMHPFDLKKAQ